MKKQLFTIFILLIFGLTAFAQPGSIDLSFNSIDFGVQTNDIGPNGNIYSTAIQSDGKIIIVGDFTLYSGTICNRIARLNSNGTLDTSFNIGQGANDIIRTLNFQSDGKIIIGGNFTSYNGIGRTRIARLNTDGGLDTTFSTGTGFDSSVWTTCIQNDDKIIIGGDFTSYYGTARNRIARLNANGGLDTTFNPGIGVDNTIRNISIQNDNKIIIGGNYTNYNGVVRYGIARINSNGSLDTTFNPQTQVNCNVYTISIKSNDKIIIGGNFNGFNGPQTLGCLNTDGTWDTTFNPGLNNIVVTTLIQSDEKIIVGGDFTYYNGTTSIRIARLNSDGTLDNTFSSDAGLDSTVYTASIQNDGKIIIGGSFNCNTFNGNFRKRIVRLNSNGKLDDVDFYQITGANNSVNATSIQNDGKVIIGGKFTIYNGVVRKGIARLNNDGTIDTSFNPGTGISSAYTVNTIAIQNDGKIIVGGNFPSFNGFLRNCIVRLNSDGTLDNTFNIGTGFDINVNTILIQSDGRIMVGGNFTSYNGSVGRYGIIRLNSNGTLDTTFIGSYGGTTAISIQSNGKYILGGAVGIARLNIDGTFDTTFNDGTGTNGTGTIATISIQNDGKIIIGGDFTEYDGWQAKKIARLNSNGTRDFTFIPYLDNIVKTSYIQSDGKIVIGGAFTTNGNTLVNRITRLDNNGNGSSDITFNPGELGANGTVKTFSIQSDGKIIIAGDFTAYNGVGRNRIARINGDNALTISSFDKSTMVIYPNPAKDKFTIDFGNETITNYTIKINNLLGQEVYSAIVDKPQFEVSKTWQGEGLYFVKIYDDNHNLLATKKIILQ